jgi:hypothetical protein
MQTYNQSPDVNLRKKTPLVHTAGYIITMGVLFAMAGTLIRINDATAPTTADIQQFDETKAAQQPPSPSLSPSPSPSTPTFPR